MDEQSSLWSGDFGRRYTERNAHTPEQHRQLYLTRFGLAKAEMNRLVLGSLEPSARILEVGCNIGFQLLCLEEMGFRNLAGVDVQKGALHEAKRRVERARISGANALALPFRDGTFDMTFTAGVLIHIAPERLGQAMREIVRCSRRYVWGFEYYAEETAGIGAYHGERQALWKSDYSRLYLEACPGLKRVREVRFRYLDEPRLSDAMFLLEKP